MVVVRLHKVDETIDWPQVCRVNQSTLISNSDSEEETDDAHEKQFDMHNLLQGGNSSMGGNSGMDNKMEEMMRAMKSNMDSPSTAMDDASMANIGESLDMSAMMKSMQGQFGGGEDGENEGMEDFLKKMQSKVGNEPDSVASECTDKIGEMLKTMQGFSEDDPDKIGEMLKTMQGFSEDDPVEQTTS
jgi:hypothetical protein